MKKFGIDLVFEASGATKSDVEGAEKAAWAVFEKAGINPWVAAAAAFKQEGELDDDLSPNEVIAAEVWRDAYVQADQAFHRSAPNVSGVTDLRLVRETVPLTIVAKI